MMDARRLIDTILDVEGDPTVYVCSPQQADTVQAWALAECPGATPLDGGVALPGGRVLRIVMRRHVVEPLHSAVHAALRWNAAHSLHCNTCGREVDAGAMEPGDLCFLGMGDGVRCEGVMVGKAALAEVLTADPSRDDAP